MASILNVPQQDIDAIEEVGAQNIANITRKYSPSQLEIIQERAKYQKRLKFWETGYKHHGKVLITLMIITGTLGYLTGERLLKALASTGLNANAYASMLSVTITMALYNIADIGRMWLFFDKVHKHKKHQENTREDKKNIIQRAKEKIAEAEDPKTMNTTNVINLLKQDITIDISKQEMGKLLKGNGFIQKKTGGHRWWKLPPSEENHGGEEDSIVIEEDSSVTVEGQHSDSGEAVVGQRPGSPGTAEKADTKPSPKPPQESLNRGGSDVWT